MKNNDRATGRERPEGASDQRALAIIMLVVRM